MSQSAEDSRRQVLMWRLLAASFGGTESMPAFETLSRQIAGEVGLPEAVLDLNMSTDNLVQRYPDLKEEVEGLTVARSETDNQAEQTAEDARDREPVSLRRALLYGRLMMNVFGPGTQTKQISAQQYQQWMRDVERFERCYGYPPGGLRGRGGGASASGTGGGFLIGEEELRRGIKTIDGEMVQRMALREVLADPKMAAQLQPSLAVVAELLRDKSNLSGVALKNAKDLIRRYIEEVADVLKVQVRQTAAGKADNSVPPKRVFRNLDLKKTLWRNLPNFNPKDGRLYVNQLYYHRKAKKFAPTRMIVVVDQSGSMVEAMVHCTILASIFSGLPHVDAHLMAFDTEVIDLTPWVDDPFEVLLRTNLGGGTLIRKAVLEAEKKIEEPKNTVMVLISDFYEGGSDQELLDTIQSIKASGVHFIPVGAVTAGGHYSVSQWFKIRLKELGMPILAGSIKKLIEQLKAYL